ncbi:hypothetical protein ECP030477714_5192 [Escherichia coli P0304777.14]|nr:hypothetical protein ECP030477714_5192 [Escherichia coli P0304777.14]ENF95811.1 hypothetical protein ECP03052604_4979 [Escherichia coli P0305260.4]
MKWFGHLFDFTNNFAIKLFKETRHVITCSIHVAYHIQLTQP